MRINARLRLVCCGSAAREAPCMPCVEQTFLRKSVFFFGNGCFRPGRSLRGCLLRRSVGRSARTNRCVAPRAPALAFLRLLQKGRNKGHYRVRALPGVSVKEQHRVAERERVRVRSGPMRGRSLLPVLLLLSTLIAPQHAHESCCAKKARLAKLKFIPDENETPPAHDDQGRPRFIQDPDGVKPEWWDDDDDGSWEEVNVVPNPLFSWQPRLIPNPD